MNDIDVNAEILARYKPFLDTILQSHQDKVHSVYLVGSALTEDYDRKTSDINSVIVLQKMNLAFLEFLAPMGKKYGKKKIAAPLIMTPEYANNSLDVFPIEFLNIKLLHHTIFGEDIFLNTAVKKSDLRYQCERELKVKLIGLRQGYISASGDQEILAQGFAESFAGYMPLFKAIIVLHDKLPPNSNKEVLSDLEDLTGIRLDVFAQVLKMKKRKTNPSIDRLKVVFKEYYDVVEKLGKLTDAIEL
jgi:predicted nucleotidyltransferase